MPRADATRRLFRTHAPAHKIVPLLESVYEVYFGMLAVKSECVEIGGAPEIKFPKPRTQGFPGGRTERISPGWGCVDVSDSSPYNEGIQTFGRSQPSAARTESDHQSA